MSRSGSHRVFWKYIKKHSDRHRICRYSTDLPTNMHHIELQTTGKALHIHVTSDLYRPNLDVDVAGVERSHFRARPDDKTQSESQRNAFVAETETHK